MKRRLRKLLEAATENFAEEPYLYSAGVPFLFALGIALYFTLPFEPSAAASLAVLEICLLAFYICRFKNLHTFFTGGLIVICGFLNIQAHSLYQNSRTEKLQGETLTYLKGRIEDVSLSAKGKTRLLLGDAENYDRPLKGKFRITLNFPPYGGTKTGSCVETAAVLFPGRPLPVMNGYKLDRKYFYDGLSATGYAASEVFNIRCPDGNGNFTARINDIRRKTSDYIKRVLPPDEAGVATALITGDKTRISEQITENYRNSGLAHFLSVSGLHLGSIAALVFFAVRFLLSLFPKIALRFDTKKAAAAAAIPFSALYLLMSGAAIPAQRAFIMTAVVLFGVMCNRQAISMRMVNFAALVILIIRPQALVSVSFQMSFAAVYALIAFYEAYSAKLAKYAPTSLWLKIPWYLFNIVLADLVASLATLPFSLYHFHQAAVYTSLGNLAAGPLIAFWLMPAVLLCLAAFPLHLAYYPLKLLGAGLYVLNLITDKVAHLPGSVWHTNALSFAGLIVIICGAFWLCIWQKPWRKAGLIAIFCGALFLLLPAEKPDMIFSDNLEEAAVRSSGGELIWLPFGRGGWVKNIWTENEGLKDMSAEQKEQFKAARKSNILRPIDGLKLVCSKGKCIYDGTAEFEPRRFLVLNGRKKDISDGGNIYGSRLEYFADKRHRRIWQSCYCK